MCNWASQNLSLDEVLQRIDEQLEQGEEKTHTPIPRGRESLWEEWGSLPTRWELSTAQGWYRAAQLIFDFQYDSQ